MADSRFKTGEVNSPLQQTHPLLNLQHARFSRILKAMEIHFTPDVEEKLNDLAAQSGRGPGELVQDALAGYFDELVQTRDMLNSRYDDLKSGRVKPMLTHPRKNPCGLSQ
jgi:predicted DNA-binding protein